MRSPDSSPAAIPHPALRPYLSLVCAVLALGFSAIFVRWAGVPTAPSGFYRMAIAAAVMALPFGVEARRRAPHSRRHLALAALAGLFFAGDLLAWNQAVLITSAANATLFGNTSAIWAGLGALVLFRQKLGRTFWWGLALALAGVSVVLGTDFIVHPALGAGDALGLLSGLFFGLFFLTTERARDGLSALVSWWVSAAVSALVLLAASLVFGQPLAGYSVTAYLSLVGVALVTQVGGYLALNYALGHLPASVVAATVLLQPVLTAALAVPLLGQGISAPQVGGGALVLIGIWLVHRSR